MTSRLDNTRRRDKLYILAEILEIVKEGTLKTQLMYRANLSFRQLHDYLNFMLKINLLERDVRNDKEIYKATARGLDFLQRYREITELLRYESNVSTCPRCQKDIASDHKFCPYCGLELKIRPLEVSTK
jgi:predicted transcriptional regulator